MLCYNKVYDVCSMAEKGVPPIQSSQSVMMVQGTSDSELRREEWLKEAGLPLLPEKEEPYIFILKQGMYE